MPAARLIGAILLLGAGSSLADDRDLCLDDGEPAVRVAACTELIRADTERGEDRALYLVGRAEAHIDGRSYRQALRDLGRAMIFDPTWYRPYFLRGRVHVDTQAWFKAAQDYTSAIRYRPDYGPSHHNLGAVYLQLHQHEKAIISLTRAIELDPESAISYYFRGIVYEERRRLPQALADYQKAISLDPTMDRAREGRDAVRAAMERAAE